VKRFLAAILVLAVAGCSKGLDSARFMDEPKTVSVAPPANQVVPHNLSPKTASVARPAKQVVPRNLSPAVRAEAPEGAYQSKETPLMECMSEACRVMCSPRVTKQSRPKWCSYFQEKI
jgi:hypothetical protein